MRVNLFFIRFPFYFALSFLILSIPIGGKKIFDHVTASVDPIVHSTIATSKKWTNNVFRDTKSLTEKAMNNIKPQADEVNSALSSRKHEESLNDEKSPNDNYTEEEKELLLKILKEEKE